MPSSLGPAEILVIMVFALIVLGPKRLPEAGRQVGRALAEVRKWSQSFQSEIKSALDPEETPAPTPRSPTPLATPAPAAVVTPLEPAEPVLAGPPVPAHLDASPVEGPPVQPAAAAGDDDALGDDVPGEDVPRDGA